MDVVGHHYVIPDFYVGEMFWQIRYLGFRYYSCLCEIHFPLMDFSEIMALLSTTNRNEIDSFVIIMPRGPELMTVSHF